MQVRKESISLELYTKAMGNIEDAPLLFYFSGHAPVGDNVGVGLSFYLR
jgi:hypothetical protein